jgi:phage virion morphogenesis protein
MLTITVNDTLVQTRLNQLTARMSNLSPAMDAIGQRLEAKISNRFESQRDPNGNAWTPWKPSTSKSYPKDGNRKILDRYSDLLKTTHNVSDGGKSVTVGLGAAYGYFHEFGTKKMVRRGILFADPVAKTLSPADQTDVLDIINRFLAK